MGTQTVKDFHERFSIIEKRVRALLESNSHLAARIKDLEQELAEARREVRELEHYRGRKLHVREKIENVLRILDSLGVKHRE